MTQRPHSDVQPILRPELPADDHALLAECDVDTYRASGPGGQNRNKVESAVRLRHRPSRLSVIAEESRSQAENRVRALVRLRRAVALRLRRPVAPEGVPDALTGVIDRHGRISVGQRDARYLPAAAIALDLLQAYEGSVSAVAERLRITTGAVSSFLTHGDDLFVETNRIRAAFGLRPLRRN